jgi:hypothetical protein
MERILFVGVLVALCGCGASEEQLRTRAAFDLHCDQSELKLTEIDSRTMGVNGCGQQVTYVESCDGPPGSMARDCTWVLNTDSTRASRE